MVTLPIKRDIEIPQGDSWRLPFAIRLPDLAAFGFTSHDLVGCTARAQIRPGFMGEVIAEMDIDYIDRATRTFRPWLPATETTGDLEGVWDLQIVEDATGWTRTFYRGSVSMVRQVSR